MKKVLIGLFALGSISSFASELTHKCNIYKLVNDDSYTRYKKIDSLDLGNRSFEFGRPIKSLDRIGLRIRKTNKDVLGVFLIEGHNFTFPTQIFVDLTANVEQRPLEFRIPVKEEMLSINCGRIE